MASLTKTKETYSFPSRFGSHNSMVIATDGDAVICKDEYGEYKTNVNQLDNGSADPNRWDLSHRGIKL